MKHPGWPAPGEVDASQPIDWGSPINRDLVFCFDGSRDLAFGTPVSLQGNASRIADATTGQAIALDGSGDRIDVSNNPLHSGMAQLTLSAWVYKVTQDIKPFGKWGGESQRAFILRENAGQLQTYIWTSTQIGGNTGIAPETGWHLYTMVYDGSNILVYVDGVLRATPFSTSGAIGNSNATMYLGSEYDGTEEQDGRIAWSRIWRRALSPAENWQLWAWQSRWSMLRVRNAMHALVFHDTPPPSPVVSRRTVTQTGRLSSRGITPC